MSLSTALDTLCAMTVSGVTTSFTIDNLEGGVTAADLPALIPVADQQGSIQRTSYGIVTTSFDETHTIRHRLLKAPVQTMAIGEAMAALVDLIDAYLAAVQTLSSHSGALDVKAVQYQPGVVGWGGTDYYGADFIVELWVSD